jgi:hypothetical protein
MFKPVENIIIAQPALDPFIKKYLIQNNPSREAANCILTRPIFPWTRLQDWYIFKFAKSLYDIHQERPPSRLQI